MYQRCPAAPALAPEGAIVTLQWLDHAKGLFRGDVPVNPPRPHADAPAEDGKAAPVDPTATLALIEQTIAPVVTAIGRQVNELREAAKDPAPMVRVVGQVLEPFSGAVAGEIRKLRTALAEAKAQVATLEGKVAQLQAQK